jgi:heat shock protein HtpX
VHGRADAVSIDGPGGAVVFDEILFRILDRDEFAAVLAHELAHIEHRDSLVQTLVFTAGPTLLGFLVVLVLPALLLAHGVSRLLAWTRGRPSDGGGLAVHERVGRVVLAAVVFLTLLVRARSRHREFAADDRAVEVTGDPVALAAALRKIERASEPRGILGALSRRSGEEDVPAWRSTHPAFEAGIERLRERATGHRPDVE